MKRSRIVIFASFLAAILLASVRIPVTGQRLDNCGVFLEGQDYYISGGTGGYFVNIPPDPSTATPPPQPQLVAIDAVVTWFRGFAQNFGNNKVAILVADDFPSGAKRFTSVQALKAQAGDDGIQNLLIKSGPVPHGEVVYEHFRSLLASIARIYSGANVEFADLSLTFPYESVLRQRQSGKIIIDLRAVDVTDDPDGQSQYTTDKIMKKLDDAISDVLSPQTTADNYQSIVVNMSFVVMPCEFTPKPTELEGLRRAGMTYEAYLAPKIGNWHAWVRNMVNDPRFRDDPLHRGIMEFVNKPKYILFVSSAGNLGQQQQDFPLYPGGWDEVVNVSASEGDPLPPLTYWSHSNIGEIMFPGAWYTFDSSRVHYAGTSFAAPVMSVVSAIRLTDAAQCILGRPSPNLAKNSSSGSHNTPANLFFSTCR